MKRTWFVVTLATLAGIAGALIALAGGLTTAVDCSSGDGGAPYVAPRSPQADICSATSDGLLLIAIGLVAAAGLAIAAVNVGRGWVSGSRRPLPFAALIAGAVIAPLGILWIANAPSNECSAEEAAAHPAECETY